MTIITESDDKINLVMKPGTEMLVPGRGLFASFPKLRVTEVVKDNKKINTEYWPSSGSLPSNTHERTIRLINLYWNGVDVKIEYDDSSKLIKVLEGNVDSVKIEIV